MTHIQEVIAASGEVKDEQIIRAAYQHLNTWNEDHIRFARAVLALAPKTALQHFADQVEASGEPEKHAEDELELIDAAISLLQHARSALNWEQPQTATGRGYVQDARAALAKVQS